jgi:hypothetical protein
MALCFEPIAIIRYCNVGRYGRIRIHFKRVVSRFAVSLSDDNGSKIVGSDFLLYLLA